MLVVASLAVIAVAYAIYHWQDDTLSPVSFREPVPLPASGPAAAQTGPSGNAAISIEGGWIIGGEAPELRVYDKKGNTRIIFRATRWNPINDTEFDLVEPTVRLTLPGTQLAYIWADEGRATILQGENGDPVAKRGQLRGNVRLFIDLTDQTWRDQHPDRAEPDQHPESVVKLWLDQVRFDLDLSFLDSDGPVTLQSGPGDLEGKGFKIVWNELDRRIQQLVIAEGRRAILRNVDLAGVSGSRVKDEKTTAPSTETPPDQKAQAAPSQTAPETGVARIVRPTEPGALPYIELTGPRQRPVEPRIETYRLTFRDNVVAKQKEGGRVIGGMRNADTLALLVDFNPAERRTMGRSMTQPAGPQPTTAPPRVPTSAPAAGSGAIELTWSGSLEILPALSVPDEGAAANRAHMLVRGPAVEIYSGDSGRAVAPEIEYRNETGQVWLRGTKDKPAILEPDERQQLVAYGTVTADQKKGIARIDGAGRLTRREPPETAPAGIVPPPADDFRNVEIAWKQAVDLEFAVAEEAATASAPTSLSAIPKGAYLKHAVFLGGASFSDQRQSIQADHIDVAFGKPRKAAVPGDPSANMVIEHVAATGHVRMTVRDEETVQIVECETLDVEVGIDDVGNNVPRVARAKGQIVARQIGRPARYGPASLRDVVLREITAQDGLILDMASVPQVVSPEEIARIEAAARARAEQEGITEGSEKWKVHEENLRRRLQRRQNVATRLRASGRVTVFDVKQELDLVADSIDCELGRGREEIRKALIVGREDRPATVELGDFFIRGRRIDVDVETQSAEVPGAGTLRFMTRQDLDGRAVDKAIPVVVTWDKQMSLVGDRNSGRIIGNVQAVSETVRIKCTNEMLLEFENIPTPPAASSRPTRHRWVFGMIADALQERPRQPSEGRRDRQIRKRLRALDAVGRPGDEASIEARVLLQDSSRTALESWMKSINRSIADLAPQPAGRPSTLPVEPVRFASRVYVKGPQINIRLDDRQMLVEGAGHLLIEDYRLKPRRRPGAPGVDAGPLLTGSSMASLDSLGPSQTAFRWTNSMSFLNNRNMAIFDSGVEMWHLSGSKMYEIDRLAAAIGADPQRLRQLPGREASLNCDRFTVEFERDTAIRPGQPAPLSRATRLKGFWAVGRQVRLEESGRFVEGTDVSFDTASQIGKVIGSPEFPARLCYLDERTGESIINVVDQFKWDQRTGMIEVSKPRSRGTGR